MTELGNPGSVFGDSTRLSFANKTFTKKELVMLGVGLLALVMCLVFVGLYGARVHSNNSPASAAQTGGGPTGPPRSLEVCRTANCLQIAGDMASYMNRSTKPCNDFFTYACAAWPKENPLVDGDWHFDPMEKIYRENREKLRKLIEEPVADTDSSSEKKMKQLFMTCIDTHGKMKRGANPFLTKVLPNVGGWYVLGANINSWNFQSNLQTTNADYGANALFRLHVVQAWSNNNKHSLVITRSGLTMHSYLFAYGPEKFRDDFKKFLRNVATLLVRDANTTMADDVKTSRINTFVDDVFSFEYGLSNITRSAPYDPDFHEDDEKVTLSELNTQSGNFIDWVSFFRYMFGSDLMNSGTKVLVVSKTYIRQLGTYVNNLGTNKNRILNNYLVWRLAYEYLQDLSWEYVHANREFYVDRTGRTEFLGTWRYCYGYVKNNMNIALSHLFIKDHFADDNKNKVHQIADYVKKSLVDHMSSFKWMDEKTRTYARNKVQATVDKLGYPDFIMDADKVDAIYSSLTIDEKDYFQNVLNLNGFQKTYMKGELKEGINRSKWYGSTFDSWVYYYAPWNELLVPAGVLQWPFYDYHIPHYLNFGSMGTIIAREYLNAVDLYGATYQMDGTQSRNDDGTPVSWWSEASTNAYNASKQCYVKALQNKTATHFGMQIKVKASQGNAAKNALEVGGLKQAYYGYKKWEYDNNDEPVAPGLGLTNDQMFFVSYAQTWCYTRRDILSYYLTYAGRLQEDHMVNQALSQMKEFSTAFKCPLNSPMNPPNKCSVW